MPVDHRHSALGFAQGLAGKDTPLARALPFFFFVFLVLSIFAVPALAKPSQGTTVKEALRDNDGNYIPDRLGETVTLRGVLTSTPIVLSPSASLVTLQDGTGGIVVFTEQTTLLVGHFNRGDLVEARGKISQYNGQEELVIGDIRRLGAAPVPAPREVLAVDLLSEHYEGQLVRASGELVVPPDFLHKNNNGLLLRDRSGQIVVYVYPSLFENPEFSERLMKGGNVEVVGILGQRKEAPPFDSGYRLVPRDRDDFHFAPIPPYRAIGFVLALCALFALSFYLWMRRRTAEQRAREMGLISENLKRSEETLRERTTYLNSLIENSPLAIVVHDADGRVHMCNKAFEQLFLYRQEEIVGAKLDDLISTKEAPSEPNEITQRVLAGEDIHVTTQRRRKDRTIVDVELHGVPFTVHGTDKRAFGLYQDITERKVLEDQLRQSQKMQAVGRLAGGVAHDFNNLLMVIQGHGELLRQTIGSGGPHYRHIEQIQKAAERAASLTQQLLAYSRRQLIAPTVLDLNFVVAEMGKMLPPLIGEDVELVTLTNAARGQVKADRSQVEQVILNLAINARDAMPDGGKLTIETSNVVLDESYSARHSGVQPGPYVMLGFSDTGCGMDAETQSHIFEPFYTTKEKGKGTGLGLATVFGVVKQSGGHIWVYSEPGRGSTFKVYLPQVGEFVRAPSVADESSEPHSGSGTVLLVEDEEAVRELVGDNLRQNGYTVLEAKNGADALEIAEKHRTRIHLMVTDVVMPGMSGRELAQRLAARHANMKVLYMSGYTDSAIVHHGVLESGTFFLQKPFRAEDLARKVRELLESSPCKPTNQPA
jgi:PAS domain S-box-containing protein